jgi:ABC-2 type transport system ATP-binding protein
MEEVDELCDLIGFINNGKLMALSDKNRLKTEYGSYSLKVTYQNEDQPQPIQEIMTPSSENLLRLSELYSKGQIISVHSTEASLSDIFQKLSALA